MGELIAGAGFISAAIAPADRFEAWREAMAPSHDIRPAQGGFGAPQVASIGWHLDDLLCSDLAFSPIGYRRWRGKSEGGVLLRLYEEGQAHGLVEEASFQTRPGEVHLFGLAPECRGVTAEWHRVKSVLIPYAAVRYDPGRHPAHISVGADTAVGRILWSSIQSLFAELPHARRAEASALAAGFASLVHGLLLSAAPSASSGGDFDAARHLAMRRYLDDQPGGSGAGRGELVRCVRRLPGDHLSGLRGGRRRRAFHRPPPARPGLPRARQRPARPRPGASGR